MSNRKDKTTINARRWTDNKLELFTEVLADPEIFFFFFGEISTNNEVFVRVKNTFEMKMDNEIFKQDNTDQVKDNATKLEYTNYNKNVNCAPSFI